MAGDPRQNPPGAAAGAIAAADKGVRTAIKGPLSETMKIPRRIAAGNDQVRGDFDGCDRDGEQVREVARSYNVSHSTISRLSNARDRKPLNP